MRDRYRGVGISSGNEALKGCAFIVTNQGEFNLRDVFGENDPARRRAAIDELWAEDAVFYDPSKGAIRGRDEIDRVAGTDFIISLDGRIAAFYMFFDKLP
jgi:hypothetical protein